MRIDIHTAAEQLFSLIRAPAGELGVLGWPDDKQPRIRVFVTHHWCNHVTVVPETFAGYRVDLEPMPAAFLCRQADAD